VLCRISCLNQQYSGQRISNVVRVSSTEYATHLGLQQHQGWLQKLCLAKPPWGLQIAVIELEYAAAVASVVAPGSTPPLFTGQA
jgi:hypothetical protein